MKILVCGGRDFNDEEMVASILSRYVFKGDILIHGGSSGADRLAGDWAKKNDIEVEVYPADWHRYGKSAGPIRNGQMLSVGKPNLVVAFPGGRGTEDMIRQAYAAGVLVTQLVFPDDVLTYTTYQKDE